MFKVDGKKGGSLQICKKSRSILPKEGEFIIGMQNLCDMFSFISEQVNGVKNDENKKSSRDLSGENLN